MHAEIAIGIVTPGKTRSSSPVNRDVAAALCSVPKALAQREIVRKFEAEQDSCGSR